MAIRIAKPPRLPSAYQEVEYIQSTGTQYIDTGIYASSIKKIDLICDVSIAGLDEHFFGCTTNGQDYYAIRRNANGDGLFSQLGSTPAFQIETNTPQGKNKLSLLVNGNNYIYSKNDISISAGTFSGSLANINTWLFGLNHNNTSLWRGSKMYFYECILYNTNDALIRDYIPCYRKSDSVIGLYDLVNGVFYTNSGTGTFLKGDDILPYHNINPVMFVNYNIKKVMLGTADGVGRVIYEKLWQDYTKLTAIYNNANCGESSTTLNKCSLIPLNTNSTFEFKVKNPSADARVTDGIILYTYSSRWGSSIYTNWTDGQFNWSNVDTVIQARIYSSQARMYKDDVAGTLASFNKTWNNPTVYLWNTHGNGTYTKANTYFYYAKVYNSTDTFDDTTLTNYWLPAKRNSDNKLGFLDIKTETFYPCDGTIFVGVE